MIIRTARRLPSAVGPSWPVSAAHSLVGPSTATRRTGATQPNPSPRTQRRSYAISKLQTKLPDEIIERLEAVKWVEGEQDPDRKIQTVPFALSPDKGREISEMAATTLFGLPHVLRLAAHRILSSWFGYTALEPTAIRQIAFSPVLLPVWMVDVVVKGKALLSDVQVDLDVSSTASPIPGFHLPPLSQLNVNPPLNNSDLVPFSPTEHLTQHGECVTLIPFTRHPLNLLKKLSSMPRRIARDEDDVSFDPKQFKESLFAAYPLYVPLYLGEYALVEDGGQEKRVTTAAFASTDGPAFAIYPSFRAFESSEPVTWLPDADSLSLTISGRPSHSAAAVAQDPETMSSMKELSPRLLRVIDEIKEERNARARESGAMGDLWAEVTDVIQGGDEAVKELCRTEDRVMAFGDWHDINTAYIEALSGLELAQANLEALRELPAFSGLVITPTGVRRSTLEEMVTELENAVSQWKDLLDEHTPEWIRRVEARRKAAGAGEGARAGAGRASRGRPAAR
ncbi:hypothetical protein B0A53_01581, partial [Rhodotorula sp. CCFEE 5036]